jgi:hypothetical protein
VKRETAVARLQADFVASVSTNSHASHNVQLAFLEACLINGETDIHSGTTLWADWWYTRASLFPNLSDFTRADRRQTISHIRIIAA